jgi:hypothetical protein
MDMKISRDRTGWLAPQCRWSPALPALPANREFFKIAASGTPETANNGAVAELPMQIPYSTEQGINSTEQGFLAQEQGIFSAKAETFGGLSFRYTQPLFRGQTRPI